MIVMILKLIGKQKGLLLPIVEISGMEPVGKIIQPESMEVMATGFATFEIKEESCGIYTVISVTEVGNELY